jgi:hypothetical protein
MAGILSLFRPKARQYFYSFGGKMFLAKLKSLSIAFLMMTMVVMLAPQAQAEATHPAMGNASTTGFDAFNGIPVEALDPTELDQRGEYAQVIALAIRLGLLANSAASACTRSWSCTNTVNNLINKYCSKYRC